MAGVRPPSYRLAARGAIGGRRYGARPAAGTMRDRACRRRTARSLRRAPRGASLMAGTPAAEWVTGRAVATAAGVRRILAPNPGPMTGPGTNTYLIGDRELVVLDPGPASAAHVEAIVAAVGSARVVAIAVTHTRRDHSPAAAALGAAPGRAAGRAGWHGTRRCRIPASCPTSSPRTASRSPPTPARSSPWRRPATPPTTSAGTSRRRGCSTAATTSSAPSRR